MERYKVISESTSGHCCFAASIVDTWKPLEHSPKEFQTVCECLEEEAAELICAALNHCQNHNEGPFELR